MSDLGSGSDDLRQQAIKSLERKRALWYQTATFVVINLFLWGVWAFDDDRGFPWPLFVTVFWGLGLGTQWVQVAGRGRTSEGSIQREMKRLGG